MNQKSMSQVQNVILQKEQLLDNLKHPIPNYLLIFLSFRNITDLYGRYIRSLMDTYELYTRACCVVVHFFVKALTCSQNIDACQN